MFPQDYNTIKFEHQERIDGAQARSPKSMAKRHAQLTRRAERAATKRARQAEPRRRARLPRLAFLRRLRPA